MGRRSFLVGVTVTACAVLMLFTACKEAPLYQQESFVFGTRVEVLIAGLDEAKARPAAAEVLAEFDRLHRTYHAWQPSELSALNAAIASGKPYAASVEMQALLRQAQALSAQSDALFDPGIGALIRMWGFQSDEFKPALPDAAALAAWRRAQPSVADLQIESRQERGQGQVRSKNKAVALDFGGYLKGYALDRAVMILRAQGVSHALINIGGNVIALGKKNGAPWRVGIQHPRQPGPLATLDLNDGEAIGTSGDYQRYFELETKRYCHLLDPRSAAPATQSQALTVLIVPSSSQKADAPLVTGTLSDVASKPLFIAGEQWPALARKMNVSYALRVDHAGKVQISQALQARIRWAGDAPKHIEVLP